MLFKALFNQQTYEPCGCTAMSFSCMARGTTEHSGTHAFCLDFAVPAKAEAG